VATTRDSRPRRAWTRVEPVAGCPWKLFTLLSAGSIAVSATTGDGPSSGRQQPGARTARGGARARGRRQAWEAREDVRPHAETHALPTGRAGETASAVRTASAANRAMRRRIIAWNMPPSAKPRKIRSARRRGSPGPPQKEIPHDGGRRLAGDRVGIVLGSALAVVPDPDRDARQVGHVAPGP